MAGLIFEASIYSLLTKTMPESMQMPFQINVLKWHCLLKSSKLHTFCLLFLSKRNKAWWIPLFKEYQARLHWSTSLPALLSKRISKIIGKVKSLFFAQQIRTGHGTFKFYKYCSHKFLKSIPAWIIFLIWVIFWSLSHLWGWVVGDMQKGVQKTEEMLVKVEKYSCTLHNWLG